jgi:hypothetical protein
MGRRTLLNAKDCGFGTLFLAKATFHLSPTKEVMGSSVAMFANVKPNEYTSADITKISNERRRHKQKNVIDEDNFQPDFSSYGSPRLISGAQNMGVPTPVIITSEAAFAREVPKSVIFAEMKSVTCTAERKKCCFWFSLLQTQEHLFAS